MLTNCLAACTHLTITVSEIERYIVRKSSFFHIPLHSTPPLGGFPSEHRHPVRYGKITTVWVRDGEKFGRYLYSFWRNSRTWPADGRTPRAGIYRAYAYASSGKIWQKNTEKQSTSKSVYPSYIGLTVGSNKKIKWNLYRARYGRGSFWFVGHKFAKLQVYPLFRRSVLSSCPSWSAVVSWTLVSKALAGHGQRDLRDIRSIVLSSIEDTLHGLLTHTIRCIYLMHTYI